MMWSTGVLLLCCVSRLVSAAAIPEKYELPEEFSNDVRQSLLAGSPGPLLAGFSEAVSLPALLLEDDPVPSSADRSLLFCTGCRTAWAEVLTLLDQGVSVDTLGNTSVSICITLGIGNDVFCEGVVSINKPSLAWIVQSTEVTPADACGTIFTSQGCRPTSSYRDWAVDIPAPDEEAADAVARLTADQSPLKVLHLADTHFDHLYTPGASAVCAEKYFCCRESSEGMGAPEDAAGYWGDYRNCDVPRWTLETTYAHIAEAHPDIELIIWTGDLIPHDVFDTTQENNLYVIREAVKMVKEYFPNTPVFPAIGNHEAHPPNLYTQPYIDNEFDVSWLYEEMASLWSDWIPAEAVESVKYGGYYAADIRNGLRILSVNTNYCYGYNWWVMYDSVDPAQVVQWLTNQLEAAEKEGVRVWVISHIPSGHDDCTAIWSHQYNRAIYRFRDTIAGIFYAHTHKDHFQMFFDSDDTPYHVAFVAQSQTVYHDLNVGYKIYHVDAANYTVNDHENWYFDLDEANAGNDPEFKLLYTAKEEYGMPDLSPSSFNALIDRMREDNSTDFDLFYKNYVKAGRPLMEEGCDAKCKSDILCRLLVSDRSDLSACKGL